MTRTVVDLIRHGEPRGGRLYRGQIDHPLSDRGWRQMWRAVDPIRPEDDASGRRWDALVSSPLLRCAQFAQALSERDAIPLTLEARFKEVGFGVWEGQSGAQIDAEDPDARRRFYQDPLHARPEGAEPLRDFSGRVVAAWEEVMNRYAGRRVLLVVHAGVIRAVVAHVLQAPVEGMYRLQAANASVTRIVDDGVRPPTLHFHGRDVDVA